MAKVVDADGNTLHPSKLVVQPGRGDRPTFVNLMCCTQVVDIEALIEGVVDYFGGDK